MKFRKKPVTIEAIQWDGTQKRLLEVQEFMGGGPIPMEFGNSIGADCIKILTLEGIMLARPGDWIIRGLAGEFRPCPSDIFDHTYEPAV